MAETSITTDGFLETTAMHPLHEDSPMETGDLSKEEEAALLCRNPGEDEDPENEIPSAQVNQDRTKNTNNQQIETRKVKQPVRSVVSSKNNQRDRKRPRDEREKSAKTAANSDAKKARQDEEQSSSIQEKIDSSNQSIGKLKSHLEKGTCPKTLRYSARANITPDEDFKNEIGSIRKKAEQALVGALVKYHHRRVERLTSKLRKLEQYKSRRNTVTKPTSHQKTQSPARKKTVNKGDNVNELAAELKAS